MAEKNEPVLASPAAIELAMECANRDVGQTASPALGRPPRVDMNRAPVVTLEVEAAVNDAFEYHRWSPEMIEAGKRVRAALVLAVLQIIRDVPPGPDRTVAIRKIREARMDANSAITHGGKY
jgi:hypothetical protein